MHVKKGPPQSVRRLGLRAGPVKIQSEGRAADLLRRHGTFIAVPIRGGHADPDDDFPWLRDGHGNDF